VSFADSAASVPRSSRTWRPVRPASAPGGTTTTGQSARRDTSAETLPSSDERGPPEPTTIIDASTLFAAATNPSAGCPTSTCQEALRSPSLASALRRSSRCAIALASAAGARTSTTRTKTRLRDSSVPSRRATRAAPLAATESSTPQTIGPATRISSRSKSFDCRRCAVQPPSGHEPISHAVRTRLRRSPGAFRAPGLTTRGRTTRRATSARHARGASTLRDRSGRRRCPGRATA
jgi:hypothetical protein